MLRLACSFAIVIFAACGDDGGAAPVSYSEPVGINLKAKSSDVVNGTIDDSKAITTESGNPYGAFIANARRELDGVDPGRIEISSTHLLLGGGTTGVARLGEVLVGDVVVQFEMNDTHNTYPAASYLATGTDSAGPLDLAVGFDGMTIPTADFAKLLSGAFKVVLRGPAAPAFPSKNADADLQTTFVFTAFAE